MIEEIRSLRWNKVTLAVQTSLQCSFCVAGGMNVKGGVFIGTLHRTEATESTANFLIKLSVAYARASKEWRSLD